MLGAGNLVSYSYAILLKSYSFKQIVSDLNYIGIVWYNQLVLYSIVWEFYFYTGKKLSTNKVKIIYVEKLKKK